MKKGVHARRWTVAVLACLVAGVLRAQAPDAATKYRLAQGLELAGDYEHAAQLFGELFARDSSNVLYFDGLQRSLVQLKQYDKAVAVIERRLARVPGDVGLRATLGGVLYKAGREQAADTAWQAAIAVAPANQNVYRAVATVLLDNRLLDRAIDVYRHGREACGDPNLFSVELAQLMIASMDYNGASGELIRWLRANPAQLGFVENRLSAITARPEGLAAAIAATRGALQNSDDASLEELLLWLELEGKDFEAAFDIARKIDARTGEHGAGVYSFAEHVYREKNYAIAARAYQEAMNNGLPAAKVVEAKYGYASALMQLGIVSDTLHGSPGALPASETNPLYSGAIAAFQKVIDEYPRSEYSAKSYYQIGTMQFQRFFDCDGALASFRHVAEEVAGTGPLHYEVCLRMGDVLAAKGDSAHAAAQYAVVAGAPDATPDQSDEANFRLAELDYFGGKFQNAANRLQSLTLNLQADYANDAIGLRDFLQENMAGAPEALTEFARADFLARQHRFTEAIALYQDVCRKFAKSTLADDALMRSAELQADAGLFVDAVASYERLLTEFKENSTLLDRAQFRLGEVYERGLRDRTKAIAAYEKLLADYPRSILADEARKRIRLLRGDAL